MARTRKWEGLEHKNVVTAGEAFAARVKQVRERKGWKQHDLSRRLGELGYPMDRVTLSKIERGGLRTRNVKLEEVLAIALALEVSPVFLIVPYEQEARLQVAPNVRPSTGAVARGWVEGRWTLTQEEDQRFFFTEQPPERLALYMEEARQLHLGGPVSPPAFELRQEMVERGEAPPIGPREEGS
jgi:transcriptional regulator with XRE-family HTH domain